MSSAPAHSTTSGGSGLSSSTSSNVQSTISSTPRTANSVSALPTGQQKRTQRWPLLAMGVDNNRGDDALTGRPGTDEMMHYTLSGEQRGSDSTAAVTTEAATASVPLKFGLGEGERDQQTGPGHNKTPRQQARLLGAEVYVSLPLGSITQLLPSSQQQQQQQQQQQKLPVQKPAQKAVASYQAISAAGGGGERDSTWEGLNGDCSNDLFGKGSDDGPVTNASGGNSGDTSPLLSVPSSSSGAPVAPVGETGGGRAAPRNDLRPALRSIIGDFVPNNPSSGGFSVRNIVEIWDTIAEDWSATSAAATAATAATFAKQQQSPAKEIFQAYAKGSLDAALENQEKKLFMLQASIAATAAASQRLAVAETLVRDINERLRACWSQSIQPAKMELERCLLEWNASFNGMPSAAEKARRAEEVVRNVERLHARARQSVVLAREAHEAASNDLIFPPLLCDDYGALVGAEHRARMAYGTAARGLENVRLQVVASRAAANRAADLVDAEASKRFFLDDDIAGAKSRYAAARRRTFDAFSAQLTAAAGKEKAARAEKQAACIVCASARTQYDITKNHTGRTLGTYQLFVFGREGGRAAGRGGGGNACAAVDETRGERAAGGASEGRRPHKRSRETGAGGELPSAPGKKRDEGSAAGRGGSAGGEGGNNEGEPSPKRTRPGAVGQKHR